MPRKSKHLNKTVSHFSVQKLAISLVMSFAAGWIGSVFTFSEIPTWYATLSKPQFSPPNWVFGPVWTTLYLLMGVSLYIVWNSPRKSASKVLGIKFFLVQLALNALWSIVFFWGHQIFGGVIVIIVLWIVIALTIREFMKVSHLAAYLLIPYLLWVSFAGVLNIALLLLNR